MKVKKICLLDGYEDVREGYYIADTGRVFSLCDWHGGVVTKDQRRELQLYEKFTYLVTALVTNSGNVKYARVNRLVALAFVSGRTEQRNVVNHIDENKQNNHFTNLEWVTPSENNIHSMGRKVFQYDKNGELVQTFRAVRFTKDKGFNPGHVAAVCRNVERSHKGFIFSYTRMTKEQVLQRLSKKGFYL